MGRVVVKCLLRLDKTLKITIADRRAPSFPLPPRVRFAKVDLNRHAGLVRVLRPHGIVINSTSHHFNLPVMRAALAAGIHYLDLGGLFHFTRRQLKLHQAFERKGLTAILGMGCAPGIANVLAHWGSQSFDRVDEIHIKVGSRSWDPPTSAIPYAVGTIREELTLKPAVYEKGGWKFKPARSGTETFPFPHPVGKQVIFRTLHSEVATLPLSFPGLRACSFKIGFPDEMIAAVLRPRRPSAPNTPASSPPKNPRDIETTVALIHGTIRGKRTSLLACCEVKSSGPHGSGDWDTAWPPAIVAHLVLKGIITSSGVFPPEQIVPIEPFFAALRKAGIRIFQKRTSR